MKTFKIRIYSREDYYTKVEFLKTLGYKFNGDSTPEYIVDMFNKIVGLYVWSSGDLAFSRNFCNFNSQDFTEVDLLELKNMVKQHIDEEVESKEEEIARLEKRLEELKNPVPKINGYELKVDGRLLRFGCAVFGRSFFSSLKIYNQCVDSTSVFWKGTNRKIKSITLDSGVTISIEEANKVCEYLERKDEEHD